MNKHIWLLFYIILAIGTTLLLSVTYIKYDNLLKETKFEQATLIHAYQQDLHTLLLQYKTIHHLVAKQYQHGNFNPSHLNNVIAQHKQLYGIAIYSAQGDLLESNQPFAHQIKNDQQYIKANQHSAIIIGNTYYDQKVNKWLTPFYQNIEDNMTSITAIYVSLLDTVQLNQHWLRTSENNIQVKQADTLMPVSNSNLAHQQYHQFYSTTQLVEPKINTNSSKLSPPSSLHNTAEIRCSNTSTLDSTDHITSLILDKDYQLCISANMPIASIKARLLYPLIVYCLVYFALISLSFVLIKWINRLTISKVDALTYEAEHDALTGLANGQTLEAYYLAAKEKESTFSLLYLDLDKFKSINDSFGHSCGDKILVEVAKRIKRSIKLYNGTAIRYSGDEFVLLVKSDDKELLQHCATHLLETVSQPYVIGQNAFRVSSSIGIACYPEDASDIETLLSYADNSMYVAKKTNAPCLFFSKSTHQQLTQRVEIEQALHHAIERQEISIVYQPQVNGNNTLSGVEALVRWNSADLGLIQPDTFIPIAEECGMMPKLGLYIMHKAMEEITLLQHTIGQNFTLSINVSVRQFIQLDFIEKFLHALTKYTKINPNLSVSIEITESLFIESIESLLPLFHKLKHHHVTLSLDDFGTGYSSLSILRDLPIDELKIDKSFVDYITTNPTDKAMVESIIGMGKKLGLTVLTEGIEDKLQADILLAAGCDLFQGYFFSKPLPIKELEAYCLQKPHTDLIAQSRVVI